MSTKERAALIVSIADKVAELNALLAKAQSIKVEFSQNDKGQLQAKVMT